MKHLITSSMSMKAQERMAFHVCLAWRSAAVSKKTF